MNVNTFAAICIFTSAYSPLALIFTIKDYDFVNKKFNHPSSLITIWAITGLTLLLLYIVIKNIRGGHRVKIKDIEERSNELVNYTIPYSIYGTDGHFDNKYPKYIYESHIGYMEIRFI